MDGAEAIATGIIKDEVELLDSFSHHRERLLGDGAYNDAALQSDLEQYRSLELLAATKVNQAPKRSQPAQRHLQGCPYRR